MAKVKNVEPETLYKIPKLKQKYAYIIDYFYELFSFGEITFQSIDSWQNIRHIQLTHFELTAIIKINDTYNKCQKSTA